MPTSVAPSPIHFLSAAGVAAALLVAACAPQAGKPPAAAPAIAVDEVAAELGTISSTLTYSGTVNPRWTVAVMSKAAGPIIDLPIQAGQRIEQGDLIAVVDHRLLDDQVAQARANVRSAEARLNALLVGGRVEDVTSAEAGASAAESQVAAAQANAAAARERLAAARAGGRAEVVAQAQAKLDAGRATLDKLLNGPTQHDIRAAQLALNAALDARFQTQTLLDFQLSQGQASREQRRAAMVAADLAIDQAKNNLDRLLAPPRAEDVAGARALVAADEQALRLAQDPSRPEDIAQLEQAVAAAEAQVEGALQQVNAQRALAAKAATPFTPQDIAQARAAVDVAKAGLQLAETAAADARIEAPAAGVISEVPVAVGSLVGPQAPIATLLAPDLEIAVAVDEGQILLFEEGQPASITGAGSSQLPGTVTHIAPAADTRTRKFTVKVQPTGPTPLRAGMSATVSINVREQQDVVLVPREVVLQRSGLDIVFVDEGGRARMRTVRTGLGDGARLPILSGVRPGEMVIIPTSVELSDGDLVARAAR